MQLNKRSFIRLSIDIPTQNKLRVNLPVEIKNVTKL